MTARAVGADRDVRAGSTRRRRRRQHNDAVDPHEGRDIRAMARIARGRSGVVHQGVGELSAIRNRQRRQAGTGSDVAHLTRQRGRQVIRRDPHDLEINRWQREGRRI